MLGVMLKGGDIISWEFKGPNPRMPKKGGALLRGSLPNFWG